MQKQRIAGCWIYANGYTLNTYNCIYVSKKRVAGNRIYAVSVTRSFLLYIFFLKMQRSSCTKYINDYL